ncbi:MAG: RES domain-containing protein [Terracidiphilus sp.]|jgi:RES domain-containing protein
MRCFRIGDARFPLFDGTGARLCSGRWNSPGRGMIYAAETYAGAILEILVHANLNRLPHTHSVLAIEIPDRLAVECLPAPALPGWNAPNQAASRAFGDRWLAEARTAVLLVPSLVTQGHENNVLLNPAHPDFAFITHAPPEPVVWDERLFLSD